MTLHPISPVRLVLLCTGPDLSARGLSPASVTPAQALSLVREACRSLSLPPLPVAEVELCPSAGELLLFARLASRPRPSPPLRGRLRRGA